MNDASRRWWKILDNALRTFGMIPWGQRAVAQQNGTKDAFTESREQSEVEAAFEKTLDAIAGSPATGKSVAGIINLFVDNLFGTGGNEMEQRVLTRPRKDFQVGSKDWSDVDIKFAGHKIPQNGPYIEVSQNKATDELEEIAVERNTRKTSIALLQCTQCTEAYWTDKLDTEWDTVPMLQNFQMWFDGSLSNKLAM